MSRMIRTALLAAAASVSLAACTTMTSEEPST